MKYIAYYDIPNYENEYRSINLAGISVMEYMSSIFCSESNLEILSPARTLHKKGFFSSRVNKISSKISLKLTPTFGAKTKVGRIVALCLSQTWLLGQLLFKTKKYETVVLYHSYSLISLIKVVKKIKKINLVLEIREIYADISMKLDKRKELSFFNLGDRYIFATRQLNELINSSEKPFVVIPGVLKNEDKIVGKFNDGKIHLVYAGNFTKTKGGAYSAINIAKYLNENYVIHLLGGDPESREEIKVIVEKENIENSAKIKMEGVLRGEEFTSFIQKCDIGLSTQDPGGDFNNTSFPSKILTYLVNGLEVISSPIEVVKDSPVGSLIHYYQNSDPHSIATLIQNIKVKKNNPEEISKLNEDLTDKILKLIKFN